MTLTLSEKLQRRIDQRIGHGFDTAEDVIVAAMDLLEATPPPERENPRWETDEEYDQWLVEELERREREDTGRHYTWEDVQEKIGKLRAELQERGELK
jgi:hypothetical protein